VTVDPMSRPIGGVPGSFQRRASGWYPPRPRRS
jgi:hypothetical protein